MNNTITIIPKTTTFVGTKSTITTLKENKERCPWLKNIIDRAAKYVNENENLISYYSYFWDGEIYERENGEFIIITLGKLFLLLNPTDKTNNPPTEINNIIEHNNYNNIKEYQLSGTYIGKGYTITTNYLTIFFIIKEKLNDK